jgi:hypothetical protein
LSYDAYFREKARQCRAMIDFAVTPEVAEQLEIWAHEFDQEAQRIEQGRVPAESMREPLAALH